MRKLALAAAALLAACADPAEPAHSASPLPWCSSYSAPARTPRIEPYRSFPRPEELPTIEFAADRAGVEVAYLLAIRTAENGGPGREFGIMPTPRYLTDAGLSDEGRVVRPYAGTLEKQAVWAARTVERNQERFLALPPGDRAHYLDFIDFLGDRYAPLGAGNDPHGLNRHWENNVRHWVDRFREEAP